jgi:hypothetical protein
MHVEFGTVGFAILSLEERGESNITTRMLVVAPGFH